VAEIKTIPFGIIRENGPRLEQVVRVTKTLVVTDKSRYLRKTGMPADYYHKSIGSYKLSEKDKKRFACKLSKSK
jgi:hypothetical protein